MTILYQSPSSVSDADSRPRSSHDRENLRRSDSFLASAYEKGLSISLAFAWFHSGNVSSTFSNLRF